MILVTWSAVHWGHMGPKPRVFIIFKRILGDAFYVFAPPILERIGYTGVAVALKPGQPNDMLLQAAANSQVLTLHVSLIHDLCEPSLR